MTKFLPGMTRPIILAVLTIAAACSAERDPAANATVAAEAPAAVTSPPLQPAAQPPALAVDGEGLRLIDPASGSARPIGFGTPQGAVMGALAFRGPAEAGRNEECGAGPLDIANWPDGLTLYFQDGAFVGWWVRDPSKGAITTVSGIGTGSTRADLNKVQTIEVAETSLGTEFSSGAMAGLLDGPGREAKVTALWAGASCVFR